jgi:hypothetical protein
MKEIQGLIEAVLNLSGIILPSNVPEADPYRPADTPCHLSPLRRSLVWLWVSDC